MKQNRRIFLKNVAGYAALSTLPAFMYGCGGNQNSNDSTTDSSEASASAQSSTAGDMFFKISLAQWSLHRTLFAKEMDNLDFAAKAKNDYGISAVEYVNAFFKDKAQDTNYLNEMKKRCDDNGVSSVLIMIDAEGALGHKDAKERLKAVENHYKWVEAAKYLGCHSIRVNAAGDGSAEELKPNVVDGLSRLCEFAEPLGIGVIVENHGGWSSDGKWLADVISTVGKANCGTLPDFGNFNFSWNDPNAPVFDRYEGVAAMMPFAKGVSAKSNLFDADGNEIKTDYFRMLQIVKDAGYTGYVGIEYEGSGEGALSEHEGILATKRLLERVGAALS